MKQAFLVTGLILCTVISGADDEASNRPHVTASQFGNCYAKSVPAEYYGSKGFTRIYSVKADDDQLLLTFDWYAREIYLECNVGHPNQAVSTSVVRFGPWARGHQANKTDLALAFYFGGQLVHSYSTLDIAGSPGNVSQSVSHYTVIEHINGYRWKESNFYTFEVVTHDGRLIAFDPTTGEIVSTQKTAK